MDVVISGQVNGRTDIGMGGGRGMITVCVKW